MAGSFFRNAYNRMIEANERRAARYANTALLRLDDETLQLLGKSREELRRNSTNRYLD